MMQVPTTRKGVMKVKSRLQTKENDVSENEVMSGACNQINALPSSNSVHNMTSLFKTVS